MNQAIQLMRPAGAVNALAVSPHESDRQFLRGLFHDAGWHLHEANSCASALRSLKKWNVDLVITDRDLDDGDWRLLLSAASSLASPPPLIVTSRVADEYLWAQVLNEGGYDLLAQPLDREEALRVISAATRRMRNETSRQRKAGRQLTAGA